MGIFFKTSKTSAFFQDFYLLLTVFFISTLVEFRTLDFFRTLTTMWVYEQFLWNCSECQGTPLMVTMVQVMARCHQVTSHYVNNAVPNLLIYNVTGPQGVNTLRRRQNGRRITDDTFKRIFLNENIRISIKISLKFVSTGPIDNIPALVQIMAWRRPGDKPLSEAMTISLLTHMCVTRP